MNKTEALELSEIIKKNYHFNYINGHRVTHHVFYPSSQPVKPWLQLYCEKDNNSTADIISEFSEQADLSLCLMSVIKNTTIVISKDFEEHLTQRGLKTKFYKYLDSRDYRNN